MKKQIWDAATGTEFIPKGRTGLVRGVGFTPNGQRTLVCGADSAGFKVWEAETGKPLFTLWATAPYVRSASFSSDGKRLLTDTGEDNNGREVRVWDVETGNVLLTIPGTRLNAVQSVSFAPDGRSIVATTFGWGVQLWDGVTGRELSRIPAADRALGAERFSADGKRFVTRGRAGAANSPPEDVKVWDTETGTLVYAISGTAGAGCVILSRDGSRVVTSDGKVARVWEVPPPKAATPRPDPK